MSYPRLPSVAALLATSVLCLPAFGQSKLTEMPPTFSPTDSRLKWGACPEGAPKGCQLAIVNGDPAKPGADLFLKLPSKSKVPSHKHTSSERIVVLQGDVNIAYDGLKPMTVRAGSYTYGPADVVHETACISAQSCVLFISFEKPVDLIPAPMGTAASSASTKTTAPATASSATSEKKVRKGGC